MSRQGRDYMKPFLSLCMIVRDEEKVLKRCLNSVKGIVDEIVIVDTGSNDRSKDIAYEFTNKVYDFIWVDDFSKARNFAASKALGKWIIVMDADEFVDRTEFAKFKEKLLVQPNENNILVAQIVNFMGENGQRTALNYHERIYENSGMISYYRNIHEMLKHKELLENRTVADLQIYHSGYMEAKVKEKRKVERNLKLLNSKKEKEPIDYYFLGNEYSTKGDLDKAIKCYKTGFQLKDSINYDWVMKLMIRLVQSLHDVQRYEEALEIVTAAEDLFPQLADFKYLKARIFTSLSKDMNAIRIFENILKDKESLVTDFSIDYIEYLPHRHLGELYEKINAFDLSVHHYSRALALNESDDYIWVKLITILAYNSSFEELVQFLNKNVLKRKLMTPIRVAKILLAVPILNVQRLIMSFENANGLSPIDRKALTLKSLFLNNKYSVVMEEINRSPLGEISEIFSKGIFSVVDFIYITFKFNVDEYKKLLLSAKYEESMDNLIKMLIGKNHKHLGISEKSVLNRLFKLVNVLGDREFSKYLQQKMNSLSLEEKKGLTEEIKKI
jgi:glycosyltransferase involved in cell wall biosynthesis